MTALLSDRYTENPTSSSPQGWQSRTRVKLTEMVEFSSRSYGKVVTSVCKASNCSFCLPDAMDWACSPTETSYQDWVAPPPVPLSIAEIPDSEGSKCPPWEVAAPPNLGCPLNVSCPFFIHSPLLVRVWEWSHVVAACYLHKTCTSLGWSALHHGCVGGCSWGLTSSREAADS